MGMHMMAFFLFDLNWWWVVFQVVIGLGLVIFVHELGHFAVAKWCGVKCEKFYLGFDIFGLKILKFKRGETEYGIGILPFGGYVKMLGQEDNPARISEELERARGIVAAGGTLDPQTSAALFDPRSYIAQSVPKRMAIISAGVIMNVIFTFVVAVAAFFMGVPYVPSVLSGVPAGESAWQSGLRIGDEIVRIEDVENPRIEKDITTRVVLANLKEGVEFEVKRPGQEGTSTLRLFPKPHAERGRPTVGLGLYSFSMNVNPADPIVRKDWEQATSGAKKGECTLTAVGGTPVKTHLEYLMAIQRADWSKPLSMSFKAKVAPDKQQNTQEQEFEFDVKVAAVPWKDFGLVPTLGPVVALQDNLPDLPNPGAKSAGVKVGDRFVALNGEPIEDPFLFAEQLQKLAGDEVSLEVDRGGTRETLKVQLRTSDWCPGLLVEPDAPLLLPTLGACCELEPILAKDAGGPAAKSGLKKGEKISSVTILYSQAAEEKKGDDQSSSKEALPDKDEVLRLEKSKDSSDPTVGWAYLNWVMQHLDPGIEFNVTTSGGKETQSMESVNSDSRFVADRGLLFESLRRIQKADGLAQAIQLGGRESKEDLLQVYWFLQKLISGQVSTKLLGGPGTIAAAAGISAKQGLVPLMLFLAMLSANLAVVNFLPIPVLDGGHMLFLIFEGLRGKPVSEKFFVRVQLVGLAFLLCLMAYVLSLDVKRLF